MVKYRHSFCFVNSRPAKLLCLVSRKLLQLSNQVHPRLLQPENISFHLLCFPDFLEQGVLEVLFSLTVFLLIMFMKWIYFENCIKLFIISIWQHFTMKKLLNSAEVLNFAWFFNRCISFTLFWNLHLVHRQMDALKHDINQKEIQKYATAYGHLKPSTYLSARFQSGQRIRNPLGFT